MKDTYISVYGSGFLNPSMKGQGHDTGDGFQRNAEARLKKYPENSIKKIAYIPTDEDLANVISKCSNIKRLDIYTHAYGNGINLGGFLGTRTYTRKINEQEIRTNSRWDWFDLFDFDDTVKKKPIYGSIDIDSEGVDWSANSGDWRCFETHEVDKLAKKSFLKDCEIFFWGCNAGGYDDTSRSSSIANVLANYLGCTVYAYVGGGGAMFITKSNGKIIYNGNMITANIALNNKGKDLTSIDPMKYLTKFPT